MIDCRNLTKRYGEHTAVDGLDSRGGGGRDLRVSGAERRGKSTTVKMLTGLLRPTSGEAFVAGHDVARDSPAVKRLIGVLPENLGLFNALTVEEHLQLCGPIYGLTRAETQSRTDQLLRALSLEEGRTRSRSTARTGCARRRRWQWRCCTTRGCCF